MRAFLSASAVLHSQKQSLSVSMHWELGVVAEGSCLQSAGGHGRAAGGQTPSDMASEALEGGGGQCSDHCLDLMTVPQTWTSCCLKSSPLAAHHVPRFYVLFVLSGTHCILVPWGALPIQPKLCAQNALLFSSPSASFSPNHLLSPSRRGSSKGLLAPLGIGKKEHLLGIVAVCI